MRAYSANYSHMKHRAHKGFPFTIQIVEIHTVYTPTAHGNRRPIARREGQPQTESLTCKIHTLKIKYLVSKLRMYDKIIRFAICNVRNRFMAGKLKLKKQKIGYIYYSGGQED